jgi:transcriptional regulator with XRE-family HTH domain
MKPNIIYEPRYQAIISRLVVARKAVGYTQEELARRIGLDQPELSRIENCQRQIDLLELLDWIRITEAADLACVVGALEGTNV